LWFRESRVDIDEHYEGYQYMTLSHCWGTAAFITLTSATLEMLSKGIPISYLPKTFRDVISVARSLGTKFLWIDSLCIMQDSLDDWQEEAGRMADVYRGSLCNIAASASSSADQGCLYPKKPGCEPQPCIVRNAWRQQDNDLLLYTSHYWEGIFENDPLRERGWVVQELLLAPRILHLGKRQLSWECYEVDACEEFPGGIPRALKSRVRKSPLEEMGCLPPQETDHWMATWAGIVHNYTSCQLTKPEDKLVALSGVAKIWQAVSQDEYIAGLWRKDLATQLLWTSAFEQQGPLEPAKEYRAPSWSWASVDGQIYLPIGIDDDLQVTILDVTVQAASSDPTGAIISDSIQLCGRLATLEVRSNPEYGKQLVYKFEGQETWQKSIFFSCSSIESAQNLHCLVVMTWLTSQEATIFECLILKPTGKRRGQFYRWGYARLQKVDEQHVGAKSHDWLEYEEFDGVKSCTISII
jgi:hypothetical protein